jgi:hypothetical protein
MVSHHPLTAGGARSERVTVFHACPLFAILVIGELALVSSFVLRLA